MILGSSSTRSVLETGHTAVAKFFSPFADGCLAHEQPFGDLDIRSTLSGFKHDASTSGDPLLRMRRANYALELAAVAPFKLYRLCVPRHSQIV
jgi:hypothetical protein